MKPKRDLTHPLLRRCRTVSRLGRLLVTVTLVQEEDDQQYNQQSCKVEWSKNGRCRQCRLDANLTRDIDDWRDGVHLKKKTCFLHDNKTRCWRNPSQNAERRSTLLNCRGVQTKDDRSAPTTRLDRVQVQILSRRRNDGETR